MALPEDLSSCACPHCGAALPSTTAEGLCPRCLFAQLGQPAPLDASVASDGDAVGDFGEYEILEEIGHGGMGVVYRARQVRLDRVVAVKVIKPGMDTRAIIARFDAERQALARMDHPGIASVFDAGTSRSGRPYFVMELVAGERITEYCRQRELTTDRRLGLFIQVCHAVQHAHQKGIIHRDLKPSNVLVRERDAHPLPTIIDFGIAKAVEGRLAEETLFTVSGQFLGTPAYLSPEQAGWDDEDIDTRSDIYSLGVLLYELLTGCLPFEPTSLATTSLEEVRRVIREVTPARPSTRLAQAGRTAGPGATASPRPPSLASDLDWIVMKCLEKDRTRRYETANGLAMDIARHLNHEPIVARPPSRLYEFRMSVRRHRFGFAAAAMVTVALAAGLAGVSWQWRRATASEWIARQNAYAADIRHAQQSLGEGDFGTALSLLEKYRPADVAGGATGSRSPEDLRNWEWRYLWQCCRSDEQSTLCRYDSWVGGVTVSGDGTTLAVQCGDGHISVWNLGDRRVIADYPAFGSRGTIAWSPVGAYLAAAHAMPTGQAEVRLWDLGARRVVSVLPHDAPVTSLAFSPTGMYLATQDNRDAIRVWEMSSEQPVATITPDGRGWSSRYWTVGGVLRFSSDGSQLAFPNRASSVRVVNWRDGTEFLVEFPSREGTADNPMEEQVTALEFSPQGRYLASGYGDGMIRLWEMATGEPAGQLAGHADAILSLAFTPDGTRLASGSGDQTIRIWDVVDLTELRCLRGHEHEVWGLDYLPDGTTLVSGSKDGSVRFWDTATPNAPPPHRILPIILPQFMPDGMSFIGLTLGGTLTLWDAGTLERTETLLEFGTNNYVFCLSPSQRWLAVAPWNERSVRVWDWATRTELTQLDVPERPFGLAFRPDGSVLTAEYELRRPAQTVGQARGYKLWHTGSWAEVDMEALNEPLRPNVSRGQFSRDGRLIGVGYETGEIEIRQGSGYGRVLSVLADYASPVRYLDFSPDGRRLAVVRWDDLVKIWDVPRREIQMSLRSQFTHAFSVAFSPDGKRLAVGSVGGGNSTPQVTLWDLETQRELLTLPGGYFNVQFSPDGSILTVNELGSRVWKSHFWRAPSWQEIEQK